MSVHHTRRQLLLDALGDGLLLLSTAPHLLRNGDVHFAFRPGSDFQYLTGFDEPHAVLVAWRTAARRGGKAGHRLVLFVQPRDKAREIWDGRRYGVDGAKERFGADEAYPIGELWQRLPDLLASHGRLFHTLGASAEFDTRLMRTFVELRTKHRRRNPPAHPILQDPLPTLASLRLIKDAHELDALRRAANATAAAHTAAMRAARPGMSERQVQAVVEAEFRNHGSARNGYESIVASGANACILHYIENSRTIKRGELLLIDAGAEIDMNTADITRTFPVGAPFSAAQRAVYDVVLRTQKAAVRAVQVGKPWNITHHVALREITKGLLKLGVLRGDAKKLVRDGACRKWFMHGTSHWLGRDVHDVGAYEDAAGKQLPLQAGMVLTVEPGLYFDARDRSVPSELRGIGIRIEDDVLVTPDGPENLTAAAPKEIRDVEALCAAAR